MKSRPQFDDPYEAARVSSFMEPAAAGRWHIRQFTVSEREASFTRMRIMFDGSVGEGQRQMSLSRVVPPGSYVSLRRKMTDDEIKDVGVGEDGTMSDGYLPIMSDTPSEISEHMECIEEAHGNVVVTGLGLGCIVSALLAKPDVDHITVVEVDRDVIDLVAPYYTDYADRLTIVNMDALQFARACGESRPIIEQIIRRPARFDYAWHDIWSHIADRNLDDDGLAEHGISYERMFAAFSPFVVAQGAWAYNEALEMRAARRADWRQNFEWAVRWMATEGEERAEMLFQRRAREHVAGSAPDPLPASILAFFAGQGLRDWAAKVAVDPKFVEVMQETIAQGPEYVPDDPMSRPNEDKEANVATG